MRRSDCGPADRSLNDDGNSICEPDQPLEKTTMNYHGIITIEPGKRGGRPCVRHMRITIADVLGWLAAGMSWAQIVSDFRS